MKVRGCACLNPQLPRLHFTFNYLLSVDEPFHTFPTPPPLPALAIKGAEQHLRASIQPLLRTPHPHTQFLRLLPVRLYQLYPERSSSPSPCYIRMHLALTSQCSELLSSCAFPFTLYFILYLIHFLNTFTCFSASDTWSRFAFQDA